MKYIHSMNKLFPAFQLIILFILIVATICVLPTAIKSPAEQSSHPPARRQPLSRGKYIDRDLEDQQERYSSRREFKVRGRDGGRQMAAPSGPSTLSRFNRFQGRKNFRKKSKVRGASGPTDGLASTLSNLKQPKSDFKSRYALSQKPSRFSSPSVAMEKYRTENENSPSDQKTKIPMKQAPQQNVQITPQQTNSPEPPSRQKSKAKQSKSEESQAEQGRIILPPEPPSPPKPAQIKNQQQQLVVRPKKGLLKQPKVPSKQQENKNEIKESSPQPLIRLPRCVPLQFSQSFAYIANQMELCISYINFRNQQNRMNEETCRELKQFVDAIPNKHYDDRLYEMSIHLDEIDSETLKCPPAKFKLRRSDIVTQKLFEMNRHVYFKAKEYRIVRDSFGVKYLRAVNEDQYGLEEEEEKNRKYIERRSVPKQLNPFAGKQVYEYKFNELWLYTNKWYQVDMIDKGFEKKYRLSPDGLSIERRNRRQVDEWWTQAPLEGQIIDSMVKAKNQNQVKAKDKSLKKLLKRKNRIKLVKQEDYSKYLKKVVRTSQSIKDSSAPAIPPKQKCSGTESVFYEERLWVCADGIWRNVFLVNELKDKRVRSVLIYKFYSNSNQIFKRVNLKWIPYTQILPQANKLAQEQIRYQIMDKQARKQRKKLKKTMRINLLKKRLPHYDQNASNGEDKQKEKKKGLSMKRLVSQESVDSSDTESRYLSRDSSFNAARNLRYLSSSSLDSRSSSSTTNSNDSSKRGQP